MPKILEYYPFEKLDPPVRVVEGFTAYEGAIGDTPGDPHKGIDFTRRKNDALTTFSVHAMHGGDAFCSTSKTWGLYVAVKSDAREGRRYTSIYAHLHGVTGNIPIMRRDAQGNPVTPYETFTVAAGEWIGQAGCSGLAHGHVHLHLELHEKDLETGATAKIDPFGAYADRANAYPLPGRDPLDDRFPNHLWTRNWPPFPPTVGRR